VNCSLIVPWKYEEDRARIWNYLWPLWDEQGFEVILAEVYRKDPWVKGRAWAEGLQKASCDVVCLMDADCHVPRLSEAVRLLSQGYRWVQGQDVVLRWDKSTTERILRGELSLDEAAQLENVWEDQARKSSAGVGTILRREDAEAVPIDRRFIAWGYEDLAWWDALTTMLGEPARLGDSLCYHLHHRPQPSKDRTPGNHNANWLHHRNYVRARGRPERMRAVLAGA
jgi:hypothetical protein